MKEDFAFQTIGAELYKQPPKTKKRAHKINNSLYWRDVIAKIDDEVQVLSIIKYYCCFSFVSYCAKDGRVVGNNEGDVANLKILR